MVKGIHQDDLVSAATYGECTERLGSQSKDEIACRAAVITRNNSRKSIHCPLIIGQRQKHRAAHRDIRHPVQT